MDSDAYTKIQNKVKGGTLGDTDNAKQKFLPTQPQKLNKISHVSLCTIFFLLSNKKLGLRISVSNSS